MLTNTIFFFIDIIESKSNSIVRYYDKTDCNKESLIYNKDLNKFITMSLYDYYLTYVKNNLNLNKKKYYNKYEIQAMLDKKFGPNEFIIISDFVNMHTSIKVRHSCGHIYNISPYTLEAKIINQCEHCASSSKYYGEEIIKQYLENNNYDYISQYKDSRCRDKNELPFDFAVFKNKKILCCIEYDGIGHYKPIERFGGEEGFLKIIHHDVVKDVFCDRNNIPMLRIPYFEIKNIDSILDNFMASIA